MPSTVTIHVTASSSGVAGTFAAIGAQAELMGRRLRASIGRATDSAGKAFASMADGAVDSLVGALTNARDSALKLAAVGPPLAGLGVVIAGVVGNLSGLASTLPAAFLAGAASMAVFKLGLMGVSEAIEAGLSGDMAKFQKALKELHPEAQKFASVAIDIAKHWKNIQRATQGALFEGAADALGKLNAAIYPLAAKWLPQMASMFSRAGRALAGFFSSAEGNLGLEAVMDGAAKALDGFLKGVPFLVQAFTDIGSVGAAMFGDFGQGFAGMSEKFAGWIRGLKNSGELQAWADRAKEAFNTLGRIAEDVGRVIAAVFKNGSDEGQTFLGNIEKQTEAWATFMESSDGAKLVDSLGTIGAAMGHLVGVIQFLSEVWLGWVAVFESGKEFFIQGWEAMTQMVISFVGTMLAVAVAAFGWIPGVGDKLKQSQRDFENWRNSSTNSLNSVATNAMNTVNSINQISGATGRAQGSINQLHGKTVYIDVIERKHMSGTLGGSGGYRGFASGGIATGMKWVGERGPELVDFGATPGTVINNGQSREMTRQGGGGGVQNVTVTFVPGPGMDSQAAGFLNGLLRKGSWKATTDSAGRLAPA